MKDYKNYKNEESTTIKDTAGILAFVVVLIVIMSGVFCL